MKRLVMILSILSAPTFAWGGLQRNPGITNTLQQKQPEMTLYSETTTLEWGCPVADRVKAGSQAEAIQKIRNECMEEVSRAAANKPDVLDVLQTRVIWPDVQVLELSDGYHLTGTFFMETEVVLDGSSATEVR